ncbi:uncharacterized protein LOC108910471 [Anoplophora glabripennis]|uniref:uncharacterized protein LOC108910471 n=1 Tax=Anoplophora glabripennis TaxID=217634 RepID=UPI00087447D5|nr:uncharacterized protein LOC108910471 [Anoplophora glabripennis]
MNSKVISAVLAVSFVVVVAAGPVVDDSKGHINLIQSNEPTIEESLMKKLNTKCSNRDMSSCMMLKLVTYFNRLMKKSNIDFGDVEITQTSTETINYDTGRSLNDIEKMSEEEQLSQYLVDKVSNFARTRALKWKMVDGADVVVSGKSNKDGSLNLDLSLRPNSDGVEEGRKKKNQDGMQALIAAAVLKAALLKALAFKALVFLVGKALLVSKLALVLAAVIGLKKLFHQEKHVTYEVVAHPHHEHVHDVHHAEHGHSGGGYDGGHGGWGRNFDGQAAQNLAYNAHVPSN